MLPLIKIMAVSNVYSRVMHFVNGGDSIDGHSHVYDHATLISSGSIVYDVLDEPNGKVVGTKTVIAPNIIFVEKHKFHRITALEKDTVCVCLHALRTVDEDLVDPDCLIDPVVGDGTTNLHQVIREVTGKRLMNPAL